MFKREKPRRWHEMVRESLWPSAGWERTAKYYGHRVTRIPGSAYHIAAGLACGVAVSFTPFIGLHLLFALGLAWAVRGSLLAAAIGTLVGNPWTFPLIWVVTYEAGLLLLNMDKMVTISEVLRNFSILNPYRSLEPVLLPLTAGAIPFMLASWVLVFFPARKIIRARKKKIAEKAAIRAAKAIRKTAEQQ